MPVDSPRLAKNNFDLLRFLFAGTVCLVHAYSLADFSELDWIVNTLSSGMAVKAFFVVSGFLIFMSFERSSSFSSYINKRIRRIYPAYFTVIMLCAISFAAVSSNNIFDYYFSLTWLKYVIANLVFLNFFQHTLPGVFEFHKLTAVDGALWTLKIEVMFYLSVPVFVWLFRKFSPLVILISIYGLSIIYAMICTTIAEQSGSEIYLELGRQLPGQLCYFMAGAFFYYFFPLFERRVGYFVSAALVVMLINKLYCPLPLFEPFALATIVIFLGLFLYVGNFGKYGDFSYGIYILHCPIIQLLIYSGWFRQEPYYFLVTAISITIIAAIVMWHVIEKKFLLRNSHYRVSMQLDN